MGASTVGSGLWFGYSSTGCGDATNSKHAVAGLLKRYGLDINSTDILQANLDSAGLPVSVVAEAAELNK